MIKKNLKYEIDDKYPLFAFYKDYAIGGLDRISKWLPTTFAFYKDYAIGGLDTFCIKTIGGLDRIYCRS